MNPKRRPNKIRGYSDPVCLSHTHSHLVSPRKWTSFL